MQMSRSRARTCSLLTVAAGVFLFGCSQNSQTSTAPESAKSGEKETAKSVQTASASTEKPDEKSDHKALSAKVLPPETWTGHIRMAYMVAKEIPEILQQLFCHCGCDLSDDHVSLYDCFTCDHSVECPECKGEAMMACKMNRKGASIAEIQKAVDLNWAPNYPFSEQPSDALRKYWKTRLWAPGSGPTPAEKHNLRHVPTDPFTGSQEKVSKTKSKQTGGCCGSKKGTETTK